MMDAFHVIKTAMVSQPAKKKGGGRGGCGGGCR